MPSAMASPIGLRNNQRTAIASRSCGSGAGRRCSPAIRLAIAATTGRSTQKLPITMREMTTISSPFIGSLPRPDPLGPALLGEQPLREIDSFLQLGHVLAELLHLGGHRVVFLCIGGRG